ncbi:MAG: hypothetical protein GEU73_08560 [Chloroflexi bacterium]|nr:hypothetical protein [Chloroflexota bacterium]
MIVGVVGVVTSAESGMPDAHTVRGVVEVAQQLVALGADALELASLSREARPHSVILRPQAEESAHLGPVTGSGSSREQLHGILPAIEAVAGQIAVPIVVDASTSRLARAAVAVGATIVRDVSVLDADPSLARVAAEEEVALIVGPRLRGDSNARIAIGAESVIDRLNESARLAMAVGLARQAVWLDLDVEAIKRPDATRAMIRRLDRIVALSHPVVVGPFGQRLLGAMPNRLGAGGWEDGAAHVSLAIAAGVQIVRVHDVARLARVVRMADAVVAAGARWRIGSRRGAPS